MEDYDVLERKINAVWAVFLKKVVKIKPLLPVLKEKKRYLLFEINSENILSNSKIESELRRFIGDLGLAVAGLRFVKNKKNKGIIQANNKSVDKIKAGLALIKESRIRTLKVSGVINKLNNLM